MATTEFVQEEFETTVQKEDENRLVGFLDDIISYLREQINDDTLDEMALSS